MKYPSLLEFFLIILILSTACSCKNDVRKKYMKKVKGDWIVDVNETIKNPPMLFDSIRIDSFKKTQMVFSFDNRGNYSFKEFYGSNKLWDITGEYKLSVGWTSAGNPSKEFLEEIKNSSPNQLELSNFKQKKDESIFVIINLGEKEFEVYDPLWNIILKLKRIK